MPILKFETKEAIPAEFHEKVTEKDGKFEVNLSLTDKVNEFREKNVEVSKQLEVATASNERYKAIVGDDTDAFSESLETMRTTQQQVDDGKLTVKGDIDAEVNKRTEAMKVAHAGEITKKDGVIKDLTGKNTGLGNEIRHNTIAHAVQAVVNTRDSGVQPSAAVDIAARAAGRFSIENGDIIAKSADGSVIYGADGTTPQSVAEWMGSLKESAPHYFIASTGGGAGGSGEKEFGGMSKEDFRKLSGAEKLKVANKQQ